MANQFNVVDGESLWDMEFAALRFCIRGLLPQGLCVLGGAPKIGKSWLVLDWCIRIARGDAVWGMEVSQGTTLYLCLEDTLQRVQHRVYCMSEEGTPNAYFVTAVGTLADDLESQISSFLLLHPDTVLIVEEKQSDPVGSGSLFPHRHQQAAGINQPARLQFCPVRRNETVDQTSSAGFLYRENRCRLREYCNGFVSLCVIQWRCQSRLFP